MSTGVERPYLSTGIDATAEELAARAELAAKRDAAQEAAEDARGDLREAAHACREAEAAEAAAEAKYTEWTLSYWAKRGEPA